MITLLDAVLGSHDSSVYDGEFPFVNLGVVLQYAFLIFTSIVLINLLIAKMSSTFSDVSAHAFNQWQYIKAATTRDFLLLGEKSPLCMLPPPFNLATTFVYPLHYYTLWKFKSDLTLDKEAKVLSVGGAVADIIIAIIYLAVFGVIEFVNFLITNIRSGQLNFILAMMILFFPLGFLFFIFIIILGFPQFSLPLLVKKKGSIFLLKKGLESAKEDKNPDLLLFTPEDVFRIFSIVMQPPQGKKLNDMSDRLDELKLELKAEGRITSGRLDEIMQLLKGKSAPLEILLEESSNALESTEHDAVDAEDHQIPDRSVGRSEIEVVPIKSVTQIIGENTSSSMKRRSLDNMQGRGAARIGEGGMAVLKSLSFASTAPSSSSSSSSSSSTAAAAAAAAQSDQEGSTREEDAEPTYFPSASSLASVYTSVTQVSKARPLTLFVSLLFLL